MRVFTWIVICFVLLLGVGCNRETAVPVPTRLAVAGMPQENHPFTLPPTNTPLATPSMMLVPEAFVVEETAVPQSTIAPTPNLQTASLPQGEIDLYSTLTIDALTNRTYGGGELEIVELMEETESFNRYLIKYPSDGLTIYGFMNVPHEGTKFPVVLVLHGYIEPTVYDTLAYTTRYADALAKAGYFVIHPNFRNYPPSDVGDNPFRTGYAIDVLNLIAILREQSQDETGVLRRADADYIHLWGHSMGGGVALRVLTVLPEPYIRAAVLYGAMGGDERRNYEKIRYWSWGSRGKFELETPQEWVDLIAPINYMDRITTPIAVHHSVTDDIVPVAWSQELCDLLEAQAHPHECYFYNNQPHTFRGYADDLLMERVELFFKSN